MWVKPREKGYSWDYFRWLFREWYMGRVRWRTRKWNIVKNLPGGMSMWSPNQLLPVS